MFVSDDARPSGRVRASVPSRIGRRLIAPALPEFLAQYPDIKLDLNVSDRQADLIREGFDCVLRVGEKTDSELVSRKLADLQLISCASRAYLERHGTPRVAQDLASHTAVGYASPFTGRVSEWSFEVNGESDGVTLATRVNASDAEMYIACCEAGLGIIQVPRFDVRDSLAAGILVEVLPDISAGTMPIAIVYAHRRNLTPRVKVFVDWLSALIAEAASG
jgi:DNA-binding transcriptional LysR family regulator